MVDVAGALEFVRDNHRAVLVTRRGDGRPQVSPVTCAVDDAGYVVVSTRETAMKTKNLARNPEATLCVLPDQFFGEWVYVSGTAEVVHLPEAMLVHAEEQELVGDLLGVLDDRARHAVEQRFGLHDGRKRSYREVGEELGVTAEAARRLVKRAVTAVREEALARSEAA